jgi:hypothetical protein
MDRTFELINEIARHIKREILNEWSDSEDKSVEFKDGLKHSLRIIDNWIDIQKLVAKNYESEESKLYDKFKILQEKGNLKSFDEITKDELYQLSIIENKADSLIGYLFNVDSKDVRKKRYKWDIKVY